MQVEFIQELQKEHYDNKVINEILFNEMITDCIMRYDYGYPFEKDTFLKTNNILVTEENVIIFKNGIKTLKRHAERSIKYEHDFISELEYKLSKIELVLKENKGENKLEIKFNIDEIIQDCIMRYEKDYRPIDKNLIHFLYGFDEKTDKQFKVLCKRIQYWKKIKEKHYKYEKEFLNDIENKLLQVMYLM